MFKFIGLIYFVIALSFLWSHYRSYALTPALLFVVFQCIMFLGVAVHADPERDTHVELLLIYLLALLLFCLGVASANRCGHNYAQRHRKLQRYLSVTQTSILFFLAVVAIVVCVRFTLQSGGNVFSMILQSLNSGESSDFSKQREHAQFMAGSGYVYQFRVFLLPVITAYLLSCERSTAKIIGFLLFPIMIFLLLSTGQRGGFVIFVLMWLTALYNLNAKRFHDKITALNRRKIKWAYLTISAAFIPLFAILTYGNGRDVTSGGIFTAIFDRILHDNQLTALVAFDYISTLDTQFGQDWLAMFLDLLPGENVYLPISMTVHAIMWGGTNGSAPPCIWGSIFYNWGYIGILIIPLCMGFGYQSLHRYCLANAASRFDVFLYSAITVCLGMWVVDSPIWLLTDGFLILVLLWFMVSMGRSSGVAPLQEPLKRFRTTYQ